MSGLTWKAFAVAMVVAVVSAATAPVAESAERPRIAGEAVEGATLRVSWEGETPMNVEIRWLRVNQDTGSRDDDDDDDDEDRRSFEAIPGADQVEYTLTSEDVGRLVAVRVRRRLSQPTATVAAAMPPSPIAPALPVSPPPPPFPHPPPVATQTPGAPARAPALLRPFPVVRIKGAMTSYGAKVTLLRVTGSRRAKVLVTCAGKGCPARRMTRKPGRIRAFERFLRAGIRITVSVTRPGFVGKHVRLVIRASKPPRRRDACVTAGGKRAVSCPFT
jgi:hypothetical protein